MERQAGRASGSMFRKKLKEARKGKNMTQQALSERLGISVRYYQQLEDGSRTGDFKIWDALEDLLGIHQRELRRMTETHPCTEDNQGTRSRCPQL